jgi:hypothetical protein
VEMERSILLTVLLALGAPFAAEGADGDANPTSIEGAVSMREGKPLEGVRVDISTAAPRIGRGIFCPSCYLDCSKWTTTDTDGRFTISKLDPSLKFRLVLTMPGHRTLQTKLIDPLDGPLSLTLEQLPDDLDPARVVSGVVTHKGVPVAGALVEPYGAKAAGRRWWGQVDGVDPVATDANGHFAITLPAELLALDIEVTSDGHCGEQLALLEPGREPRPIEMRSGANVIGRLVLDGQPVAGMSIAVVQLERGAGTGIFVAAVGAVTDKDGRFEFQYLPPDQRYCIYSLAGDAKRTQSPHILTTKTFSVPGTGETRDLGTLEVSSPLSIRGTIRRVDDQPLPSNLKLSFDRDPAWDLIGVTLQNDGSFEVTGLPPETYEIRVGDRELVIVADQVPYQMLSEASFGLRLRDSISDLVIPVRAKD